MSSLARPSGPLPSAVYWRRRAIVLTVALLLVLVVAKALTLGSDAKSDAGADGAVTPAAADTSSTTTDRATPTRTKKPKPTKTKTPLAEPDGPCTPSDVVVRPVLDSRHASDAIRLKMKLTTRESAACLFTFDAETVTLKITSGDDLYWRSADCPAQVPSKELVLRSTEETRVDLIWNGKRSGEDCTKNTEWALPGYYHLAASALGGEPADDQFELRPPKPVTVTSSPDEDEKDDEKKDKGKNGEQNR